MTATITNRPYREANSALTFGDLLLEVAREMGVAFYGDDGTEIAQIPDNMHDLEECKRHVNNGLRMFFNDAPPAGWRFNRPTLQMDLWGTVAVNAAVTATAVTDSGKTIVTVSGGTPFSQSMEHKMMAVTGLTNDVMITKVLTSSTAEINLNGESDFASATFSITANGVYTMPPWFSGMVHGHPTFAADTNEGVSLRWMHEAAIRQWRQNSDDSTGTPNMLATRIKDVDGLNNTLGRRRYELLAWPTPSGGDVMTIEFPCELHFDKMENEAEYPPTPVAHDEALKAACLAVVERDVYDRPGRHWEYYKNDALPKSHNIDARTGPRSLGYFGNPTGPRSFTDWRANYYDRPEVTGDNFI